MKKLFYSLMIVLGLAYSLLATQITVSSTALNNWRFGGASGKLRIVASQQFTSSTGEIVMPGSVQAGSWYKEVTCAISGTTITIPQITDLPSTTDSSVPNVTYTAVFYDSKNIRRDFLLTDFRLPTSLGTTLTWAQIIAYNKTAARPPNPLLTYYTSDQTNSQILSVLNNYANTYGFVTNGDTRLVTNLSAYSDSLAAAVTSIGAAETVLAITRPVTVGASLTVPKNIKLDISGTGLITVAANQTLTVGSMQDPGNRKVFVSTATGAKVLFSKSAVKEINTAWWTGNTSGASITDALSEALESANANQGIIHIPTGTWLSAGGHVISDSVVITGEGNNPTGGYATTITLTSPATTYLFKIGEGEYSVRFKDLVLDGTGTSSKDGVLLEGAEPNTSGDLSFTNVTFSAFANGLNYNSTSGTWQYAQVKFDACIFQQNTAAGIKANSVNSQFTLVDTNFAVPAGGKAFNLTAIGALSILGSEFAGGGATSEVMRISGSHGAISFYTTQDENFGTFIQNDASDASGIINIFGSLVQSKIQVNQSCVINSFGSNYLSKTFVIAGGAAPAITSRGDHIQNRDVADGVTPVNPPRLAFDVTLQDTIIVEENGINNELRYRQPAKFLSPLITDNNPTIPIVGIGHYTAISQDKPALRIGRTDASGTFDFYYDIYRKYANGRLQFEGNQTGFIGFDFNGDAAATNFIGNVSTPAQITANQNNYNPGTIAQNIRLSSDASRNLTGLNNLQTAGQTHWLTNVGSFNIVLKNQDAASTAAYRFANNTGADITLLPNDVAFIQYDAVTARWRTAKFSAAAGTDNRLAKFSANNPVNSSVSDSGSLVTVTNPLTVTGTLTASGAATVGTTLGVTGAATLSGGAQVATTFRLSTTSVVTPSATPAINAALGNIFTLTPGEDETISVTGMTAGQTITLIILTSGTTSRTLTFGSGFKSAGTLATGTTTAKYFVLQFFSDGTNVYELSRTAAL